MSRPWKRATTFFADVPPLEDLSNAIQKAKAFQRQWQKSGDSSRANETRMRCKGSDIQGEKLLTRTKGIFEENKEAKEQPQSFGGFSKGFLLSSSTKSRASAGKELNPKTNVKDHKIESATSPVKKNEKSASELSGSLDRSSTTCSSSGTDEVPYLRHNPEAAGSGGPVFPEVQQALKEAYPLLNTQGWKFSDTYLESGVVE